MAAIEKTDGAAKREKDFVRGLVIDGRMISLISIDAILPPAEPAAA